MKELRALPERFVPDRRHSGLALLALHALLVSVLAGCTVTPRFDAASVEPVELTNVPFFPQTKYQCGPAALATVLAYEGIPVTADDLVPAVYVEGLRGSLQAELLAATRRSGLVPYPIEPDPDVLFEEVASGRPVLVLQNLGLPRVPRWHYAVVVGFDAERERVLLRSGTEKRRSERIGRFLRSWRRAENWGFVAVEPGELPATAGPTRYIRALAGADNLLDARDADAAYDAAAARWPENGTVAFAAAGRHMAAQRWEAAAVAYEALLEREPENIAARNNLANARAEQGCRREALHQAQAALQQTDDGDALRPAVEDTVESLLRANEAANARAAAVDGDVRPAGGDAVEPAHCPDG